MDQDPGCVLTVLDGCRRNINPDGMPCGKNTKLRIYILRAEDSESIILFTKVFFRRFVYPAVVVSVPCLERPGWLVIREAVDNKHTGSYTSECKRMTPDNVVEQFIDQTLFTYASILSVANGGILAELTIDSSPVKYIDFNRMQIIHEAAADTFQK